VLNRAIAVGLMAWTLMLVAIAGPAPADWTEIDPQAPAVEHAAEQPA
jgi:hypothetical protein